MNTSFKTKLWSSTFLTNLPIPLPNMNPMPEHNPSSDLLKTNFTDLVTIKVLLLCLIKILIEFLLVVIRKTSSNPLESFSNKNLSLSLPTTNLNKAKSLR